MKSFFSALTLSLFACIGLAQASEPEVHYLSWCDREGRILAEDEKGNVVIKADCEAHGMSCKTLTSRMRARVVISAVCTPDSSN
ncbi:MAG: hypothetical protein NDJ89_03890 [Oligoflexia bacterium]|nr:hypothetical protein [Oligoflexia bacterium]